jgi:hypothetical protein
MALACSLLGFGAANSAHARGESCAEDADCASSERCEKGDSAVDCVATPPGSGEGDSDGEGADRSPGAGCGEAPAEPQLGSCEPAPIECEAHADCPEGLVCRKSEGDGDCTASSEGGEAKCTSEPEPGRCVYEAEPCDGTCDDDRYACLAIGEVGECSAQPGAPCPNNGECPPPPEPVCTQEERRYCFPARVDCATDADCDGGWQCVALSEDAKDDAPEGWEGADRLCLPEGLALAIEGKVDVGGGTSESSQDSTAGEERPAKSGDDNTAPEDGQPGGPVGTADSSDGCAVAEPGARAGSALPWLALLGLGLTRRRGLRCAGG